MKLSIHSLSPGQVYVGNAHYCAVHRKMPKGRGAWTFCPTEFVGTDSQDAHLIHAHGTFGHAKGVAQEKAAALGFDRISTLP